MTEVDSRLPLLALWIGDGAPPAANLADLGIDIRVVPKDTSDAVVVALAPDLVVLGAGQAARAPVLRAALLTRGRTTLAVLRSERDALDGLATLEIEEGPDAHRAQLVSLLTDLDDGPGFLPESITARELDVLAASVRSSARAASVTGTQARVAWVIAGDGELVGPLAGQDDRNALSVRERSLSRTSLLGAAPRGGAPRGERQRRLKGATVVFLPGPSGGPMPQVIASCRELGANVVLAPSEAGSVESIAQLDPLVLVLDRSALEEALGVALLADPRFVDTGLLVFDDPPAGAGTETRALVEIARLCAPELEIKERLELGEVAVGRLELLGAARWLKIASERHEPIALEVRGPEGVVRMDFLGRQLEGQEFLPRGGFAKASGPEVLNRFLGMKSGAVFAGAPDEVELGRNALVELGVTLALPPAVPSLPRAAPAKPSVRVPSPFAKSPSQSPPVAKSPSQSPPAANKPLVPRPASVPPPAAVLAPSAPKDVAPIPMPPGLAQPAAKAPRVPPPKAATPQPATPPAAEPARATPPASTPKPAVSSKQNPASRPPPAPLAIHTAAHASLPPVPDPSRRSLGLVAIGGVMVAVVLATIWAMWPAEHVVTPPPPPPPPPPVAVDAGVPDAPVLPTTVELASMRSELDALRESRSYVELESGARAFLVHEPGDAHVVYLLSLALFRQHRPEDAQPFAEQAIELEPDEGEFRLLLGDIHANRGRFPRARRVWADCVAELPNYQPCARRVEEHGSP